jgi:hypothetical protein
VTTLCHLLSPFSGLEWFIVIEKNPGDNFLETVLLYLWAFWEMGQKCTRCLMRTKGVKSFLNPKEFDHIIFHFFLFWPGRVFWPGRWPANR